MILTQTRSKSHIASVNINNYDLDELLSREWLLSNSRGSFCSSSVIGCNTRRYHSLLTGSTEPPANRTLALSNCQEMIYCENEEINISHMDFSGAFTGSGVRYQQFLRKDTGIHFDYDFGFAELTKSLYLLPDSDAICLIYDFTGVEKVFNFTVRPLIALRDFHSLIHNPDDCHMHTSLLEEGIIVGSDGLYETELFMRCEQMWYEEKPQWWHNFHYRKEKERQQDCSESLWSPGIFNRQIDGPAKLVFWASFGKNGHRDEVVDMEPEIVIADLELRQKELFSSMKFKDRALRRLYSAANDFVIERKIGKKTTNSILAGFPWFLDWGRDTFIALPGLLLETERYTEAFSVLETFAHAVNEGMIPNRFDDYGGEPHYNSIDASLWFIDAAFKYHRHTQDTERFIEKILPAVQEIIEYYHKGTRFGIHAENDGLIMGGSEESQLTWMDAKCCGQAFTPRYGKAVEVNALWYNALCCIAEFYHEYMPNKKPGELYTSMAQTVEKSFTDVFWNDDYGWLADCILPDGTKDLSLRPNQIFAISLPFSPLDRLKQKMIIEVIAHHLLTPYGLRTLSPDDPKYKARYQGNQFDRDSAYHQGTVWPFLLGPFVESYLRVNDFSATAKSHGRDLLEQLLKHLKSEACIGSISEIFDGDPPHTPRGCFAQAWSVASVLQAYKLTT